MDISSFIGGLRVMDADEVEFQAHRKAQSLKISFDRLAALDPSLEWSEFLAHIPKALLSTQFASSGLDQHYTTLLSGLLYQRPVVDAVAVAIVNYAVQQLTYQGRYLGTAGPEFFALSSRNAAETAAMAANTDRIPGYLIGQGSTPDDLVTARLETFALNAGQYRDGGVTEIITSLSPGGERKAGCLAFLDLKTEDNLGEQINFDLENLTTTLTRDTYYIFGGASDVVAEIYAKLVNENHSQCIFKSYTVPFNGAFLKKAILVVTGREYRPVMPDFSGSGVETFTPAYDDDLAKGVQGVSMRLIHEPERINLASPTIISSGAPLSKDQVAILTTSLVIHHEAAFIRDGRYIAAQTLHNDTYVVISSDNKIVEPVHEPGLLRSSPIFLNRAWRRSRRVRKPMSAASAFLWLFLPSFMGTIRISFFNAFPRIAIARQLGILETFRFLIPSSIRNYQLEMMYHAGISESQLVFMDGEYDYVCEELIVPRVIPAIFTPFYTDVYDRLVDKFAKADEPAPGRRILISRAARTTWRNMVNYDAICDVLIRDLGFELVSPEKLSLEDEIQLFRSASVVVGAEGAGLYNCCFMRPGTDVVCLADQDYVMYVLGSIANHRGFDCSFVFGESFQADRDLTRRAGHSDFVVDPDRVKAAVATLIERRNAEGAA